MGSTVKTAREVPLETLLIRVGPSEISQQVKANVLYTKVIVKMGIRY